MQKDFAAALLLSQAAAILPCGPGTILPKKTLGPHFQQAAIYLGSMDRMRSVGTHVAGKFAEIELRLRRNCSAPSIVN